MPQNSNASATYPLTPSPTKNHVLAAKILSLFAAYLPISIPIKVLLLLGYFSCFYQRVPLWHFRIQQVYQPMCKIQLPTNKPIILRPPNWVGNDCAISGTRCVFVFAYCVVYYCKRRQYGRFATRFIQQTHNTKYTFLKNDAWANLLVVSHRTLHNCKVPYLLTLPSYLGNWLLCWLALWLFFTHRPN